MVGENGKKKRFDKDFKNSFLKAVRKSGIVDLLGERMDTIWTPEPKDPIVEKALAVINS